MTIKLEAGAISVSDMERSLTFYRDLLGMEVVGGSEEIFGWGWSPAFGVASERPAQVVGFEEGLRLVEFVGDKSKPLEADAWDFGTAHVALEITDLDQMYENLSKEGVNFLAPPYEPQATAKDVGRIKFTNMQGPDGERISLNEFPGKESSKKGFVEELNHGAISVSEIGNSIKFYQEGLGLELLMGPIEVTSGEWDAVLGIEGVRFRTARFAEHLDIVQFVRPAGKPLADQRPWSPGTTRVGFSVSDLDEARERLAQLDVEFLAASDDKGGANGERSLVFAGPDGEAALLSERV